MKAAKVRHKSFNKLQDSAEIGISPIGCHRKQKQKVAITYEMLAAAGTQ